MVSMNRLFPLRAIGHGFCMMERDRFTAVLEAMPVHFDLRSEAAKARLIDRYVRFLNGLSFPVQFLVRADVVNMDDYLAELKRNENQLEAHLRPSLHEYVEFIRQRASVRQLIRRRYYVLLSWRGIDSRGRVRRRGEELWNEAEAELLRREEIIEQGLRPLGVRLRRPDAEETFRVIYASIGAGQTLPRGVNWVWE